MGVSTFSPADPRIERERTRSRDRKAAAFAGAAGVLALLPLAVVALQHAPEGSGDIPSAAYGTVPVPRATGLIDPRLAIHAQPRSGQPYQGVSTTGKVSARSIGAPVADASVVASAAVASWFDREAATLLDHYATGDLAKGVDAHAVVDRPEASSRPVWVDDVVIARDKPHNAASMRLYVTYAAAQPQRYDDASIDWAEADQAHAQVDLRLVRTQDTGWAWRVESLVPDVSTKKFQAAATSEQDQA